MGQVKIYRMKCKLCGRIIESDNYELVKKNMRHHLISHEEMKPLVEALLQIFATFEVQEVEDVVTV